MSNKRYLFYISQNYSYAILRPLQEAICARGDEVCWFLEGEEVNPNYLHENENRLSSIKEIMDFNPLAIFYPANMAPTFLPGINVAIFHGFDAGKVDKRGSNDHFKIRNCFDLYCTQGPNTTKPFKELEKKHEHFKVIETGWCALDPLYQKKEKSEFDKKSKVNKKTILLCSTFSKKLSCAPDLFETVKRLSQTGKWYWLVQFHPKMPKKIVEQYKSIQGDFLTFVETDNIIPLLKNTDVMVCDTSSVLIMFLLTGKPVVTYKNISPQDYLFDITKPGLLESSIEKVLENPPQLMLEIETFVRNTHPYNDGASANRVLNAVDEFLSEKKSLSKKPFDFFRQFKMRKKLKYWYI